MIKTRLQIDIKLEAIPLEGCLLKAHVFNSLSEKR